MDSLVEEAILAYLANNNDHQLGQLDAALVIGTFLVPVLAPTSEVNPGKFDVPAICISTPSGGALPVFTSIGQLQLWKPQGCQYTPLKGDAVIRMALGMSEVSQILINIAGAPRGLIPRSDFARLLLLASS